MPQITQNDLAHAVRRAREETPNSQAAKVATTAQRFLSWNYDWAAIDRPEVDAALQFEITTQTRLAKR
jgi:hypothetical protein